MSRLKTDQDAGVDKRPVALFLGSSAAVFAIGGGIGVLLAAALLLILTGALR